MASWEGGRAHEPQWNEAKGSLENVFPNLHHIPSTWHHTQPLLHPRLLPLWAPTEAPSLSTLTFQGGEGCFPSRPCLPHVQHPALLPGNAAQLGSGKVTTPCLHATYSLALNFLQIIPPKGVSVLKCGLGLRVMLCPSVEHHRTWKSHGVPGPQEHPLSRGSPRVLGADEPQPSLPSGMCSATCL